MPSARTVTAAIVNPGAFQSWRNAKRKSLIIARFARCWIWGAHACSVLANAFRVRELLHVDLIKRGLRKFVSAECRNQPAAGGRSPDAEEMRNRLHRRP